MDLVTGIYIDEVARNVMCHHELVEDVYRDIFLPKREDPSRRR